MSVALRKLGGLVGGWVPHFPGNLRQWLGDSSDRQAIPAQHPTLGTIPYLSLSQCNSEDFGQTLALMRCYSRECGQIPADPAAALEPDESPWTCGFAESTLALMVKVFLIPLP